MFLKIKQKEFEDTKAVIIIRKSKERQHNGLKKKNKKKYHFSINDYCTIMITAFVSSNSSCQRYECYLFIIDDLL
jgi:hypothetical protein